MYPFARGYSGTTITRPGVTGLALPPAGNAVAADSVNSSGNAIAIRNPLPERPANSHRLANACMVAMGLTVLERNGGPITLTRFVRELSVLLGKAEPFEAGAAYRDEVRSLLQKINGRLQVGDLPERPGTELVFDRERWLPASDYFIG